MSQENTRMRWYDYILNKYFIVGAAFVVWMLFFDQNSFLLHRELDNDITELKEDRAYFEGEILREQQSFDKLNEDPEEFERLAREKYLMKRDNEDIFVIEKKDTLKHE